MHDLDKNNVGKTVKLTKMTSACHLASLFKSRLYRNRGLLSTYGKYFVPCCFRKLHSIPLRKTWTPLKKKTIKTLKLFLIRTDMANSNTEEALAEFRLAVKTQGDLVRKLKEECAPEIDIKEAVALLKQKKRILEEKEMSLLRYECFNRDKMEDVLKRRFFYGISFSIYGGVSGQYDYGPVGCALKNNIISLWRNFFILEEQMLEVDCSIVTPEPVLKTSGHVDKFADYMVRDVGNGECFRLDHLIKNSLEKLCSDKKTTEEVVQECQAIISKLDGMTKEEMTEVLRKFDIKSPISKNDLSDPVEFNLMFGTELGPQGLVKGYLRPETAQGIFVNFDRLLNYNQGQWPFAAAQVGQAFRNEISPRSGLIRVREFTLAEIEHFCHPDDKSHPKFSSVADTILVFYSACNQMAGEKSQELSIGEAVKSRLVANETLGYYLARIQLFLLKIGMDPKKIRFRQHMSNEIAHYASDCWDAECLTSYGWIECVGCADRSAFDLTQHSKATRTRLTAQKFLSDPKTIDACEVLPEMKIIGKEFTAMAKSVRSALLEADSDTAEDWQVKLEKEGFFMIELGGINYKITKEMVNIKKCKKKVHVEEFVPNVIEPSFGIGRILYALLEHTFKIREGNEVRTFFSIPPCVAPVKCSVIPLMKKGEKFQSLLLEISSLLSKANVSHKVEDGAGSVGRKYCRADEIAIPFGITVDYDSFEEPSTVTLRERDTMLQVRIPVDEVAGVLSDLCNSKITWEEVQGKYPKFESGSNEDAPE